MESVWYRWLRGVWDRVGVVVARARRGPQRLPVVVDELPDHNHFVSGNGSVDHGYADDVLRLLHRDPEPAAGGSGPRSARSIGPLGPSRSWSFSYPSGASYTTTGYGSPIFWITLDCE